MRKSLIEKQTDIIAVGSILDLVYSGKAFAGQLDLLGNGRFAPDAQLVFCTPGAGQGCGPVRPI